MEQANPRKTALKILYEVDVNGAYANIALAKALSAAGLDVRNRGLVSNLVYGTLQHMDLIDYTIRARSRLAFKKISPWIRNILRLGIYQLAFLDKIPVSAAVNESVKLAARFGHQGSKAFVNGLLRSVADHGLEEPPKEDLALRYSFPQWLADKWVCDYGPKEAEALMRASNEAPPVYIRVNTLKTTAEALLAQIKAKPTDREDVLIFQESGGVEQCEAFLQGLFTVQDKAFSRIAHVLDPQPGERVLDACAAPGGKTTHLAERMQNRGEIVAFDIYEHKIQLVKKAASRLGITIINPLVQDAGEFCPAYEGYFDKILLDVPCSGLGIIRRKPDIKRNRRPEDDFGGVQQRILQTCSRYLKPGGRLLYSTCTYNREENEGRCEAFAAENGFTIVQTMRTFPHKGGEDGMFLCLMEKG